MPLKRAGSEDSRTAYQHLIFFETRACPPIEAIRSVAILGTPESSRCPYGVLETQWRLALLEALAVYEWREWICEVEKAISSICQVSFVTVSPSSSLIQCLIYPRRRHVRRCTQVSERGVTKVEAKDIEVGQERSGLIHRDRRKRRFYHLGRVREKGTALNIVREVDLGLTFLLRLQSKGRIECLFRRLLLCSKSLWRGRLKGKGSCTSWTNAALQVLYSKCQRGWSNICMWP